MADFQLQRHMLMNLMQKDNLIYLMGNSVSGISNKVSDETYDYDYSYTKIIITLKIIKEMQKKQRQEVVGEMTIFKTM